MPVAEEVQAIRLAGSKYASSKSQGIDERGDIFEFPIRVRAALRNPVGPPHAEKTRDKNRGYADSPGSAMLVAAAITDEDGFFWLNTNGVECMSIDPRIRFSESDLVREHDGIET